ncbi:IS3 family transposase [Enorma phocaeensis]|uniref:IS3 family transposase n=1 Tax=Enorma phocaeensis TaxID=1871019 RepID=UPI003D18CC9B
MCSALKVTRQGCYAWRSRGPSARDERDAEPASRIAGIHAASRGTYGAPKVFAELRRSGVRTSRKRAARIMREGARPAPRAAAPGGRRAGRSRPRRRRTPHRTW